MMQRDDATPTKDGRAAPDREAAVLEELVARERAALEPYFGKSDPSAYVALFAEEATYFDPNTGGGSTGTRTSNSSPATPARFLPSGTRSSTLR